MKNDQDFEIRFTQVFNPTFFWGVGTFELILVLYTLYMEFVTGSGPSLLSTILPLSVVIVIMWAVLAALISLAIVGMKNRTSGTKQ